MIDNQKQPLVTKSGLIVITLIALALFSGLFYMFYTFNLFTMRELLIYAILVVAGLGVGFLAMWGGLKIGNKIIPIVKDEMKDPFLKRILNVISSIYFIIVLLYFGGVGFLYYIRLQINMQ